MLVIGIGSTKGGVGKSALACQLACWWSHDHRVVLIDADPNQSSLQFHARGTHRWKVVTPKEWTGAHADIAIADLAGGHRGGLAELASGADVLLIPCPPTPAAVAATLAMAPTITPTTRAVLTMVDARRPADASSARAALERSGVPVLKPITTRLAAWERAEALGLALADVPDRVRMTAHAQLVAIAAAALSIASHP